MVRTQPAFRVTMSGVDKLMPDVDVLRVFESRLVHQLDRGRVLHCTQSALLYFWEAEGGPVRRGIEAALKPVGRSYCGMPVVMDTQGGRNKPRQLPVAG